MMDEEGAEGWSPEAGAISLCSLHCVLRVSQSNASLRQENLPERNGQGHGLSTQHMEHGLSLPSCLSSPAHEAHRTLRPSPPAPPVCTPSYAPALPAVAGGSVLLELEDLGGDARGRDHLDHHRVTRVDVALRTTTPSTLIESVHAPCLGGRPSGVSLTSPAVMKASLMMATTSLALYTGFGSCRFLNPTCSDISRVQAMRHQH